MKIRETLRRWLSGNQVDGYSELMLQQVLARAQSDFQVSAIGAVESAIGMLSRAFCMADIHADRNIGLDGASLANYARAMLTRGEVAALRPQGEMGRCVMVANFEVSATGSDPDDEGNWYYHLDLDSPGASYRVDRPSSDVFHFRYAITPTRQWRGLSPLESCSAVVANTVERALGHESKIPVGAFVPLPSGSPAELVEGIRKDLASLNGRVMLPETLKAGHGLGMTAAPHADYKPSRIQPAPSETLLQLRDRVVCDLVSSLGVPPVLLGLSSGGATESDAREAFRRFLHIGVRPLAEIFRSEIRRKTGSDLEISFDRLQAADIGAKTRSYKQLVEAGMPSTEAARIVGFEMGEDS